MVEAKRLERAYVVTRSVDDLGRVDGLNSTLAVMRIPALLLCYWMGAMELRSAASGVEY